jgi:hypothetical protein
VGCPNQHRGAKTAAGAAQIEPEQLTLASSGALGRASVTFRRLQRPLVARWVFLLGKAGASDTTASPSLATALPNRICRDGSPLRHCCRRSSSLLPARHDGAPAIRCS